MYLYYRDFRYYPHDLSYKELLSANEIQSLENMKV